MKFYAGKIIANFKYYANAGIIFCIVFSLGLTGCLQNRHFRKKPLTAEEIKLKQKDFTTEFGDIIYLKSWGQKYTKDIYEKENGVRSKEATFFRIRYEMLKMLAEREGEGSPVWNLYHELRASNIINDSLRIEYIYEKAFCNVMTKFGKGNFLDDKLFEIAEKIRYSRDLYGNPWNSNMCSNEMFSRLLNLGVPEVNSLNDSLAVFEFPNGQIYLCKLDDATRNYYIIPSPVNDIVRDINCLKYPCEDQSLVAVIPPQIPDNIKEANEQLKKWEGKVVVKNEDLLPVQTLHIMLPHGTPDSPDIWNKVGINSIWYFRLDQINPKKKDSLNITLEILVNPLGSEDSLVYKKVDTVYNIKGLNPTHPIKISLSGGDFHTIKLGHSLKDVGMSKYKISTKMTTCEGEIIQSTFFELPNSNIQTPAFEMYSVNETDYVLGREFNEGDTINLQIPVSGAFSIPNNKGIQVYSSSVSVYWEPEKIQKKTKEEISIGDLEVLRWDPGKISGDSLRKNLDDFLSDKNLESVITPTILHKYTVSPKSLAQNVTYSNKRSYFEYLSFVVPEDIKLKGAGVLRAKVTSYHYGQKKELVINEAKIRIFINY
ncbi:MAG: hypothetical protein U9N54_02890 [candidate division Zixibacteria bacterium]|nr:hypothetical protein [candidate division Zixibacteria bacterium]